MKLAPIVLFTYNRPWHTQQTVEALLANEYASKSDLIIYSDAPKNETARKGVEETRAYLQTITGFKSVTIREREINFGLAENIIDGVTSVVNEYGRIIVLEDDLLTSPFFLRFMNEGLNTYEHVPEVVSIHGYVYPVKEILPVNFFLNHTDSLGWGTWTEAWKCFNPDGRFLLESIESGKLVKRFNMDGSYNFIKMLKRQIEGRNSSWAIRWYASAFIQNKLSLFPQASLVFHNGGDSTGTNCGDEAWLDVELSESPIPVLGHLPLIESAEARRIYASFFHSVRIPLTVQIKNKLNKWLCR